MEELLLRIQAVLKRVRNKPEQNSEQTIFELGNYVFDYQQNLLTYNERKQKLTHKESELLRLLCLHKDNILKRNVALQYIWNDDTIFTARSMDVYLTKLRKYLKHDPHIKIKNLHGEGFKLTLKS
jgi:DNA-binding response OmpR family regulator